ncbi:hypothetical protein CEP54_015392 [Fusarium duplospermum]|uniref:Uncharacterized protein n=1 Tax=Fusarium duplospermum TaxID=1325734 RepID=A0A428NPF5_9HYPO|nr:hypothetical protein CEP54_015392 [Fusarium duplospermum]
MALTRGIWTSACWFFDEYLHAGFSEDLAAAAIITSAPERPSHNPSSRHAPFQLPMLVVGLAMMAEFSDVGLKSGQSECHYDDEVRVEYEDDLHVTQEPRLLKRWKDATQLHGYSAKNGSPDIE